MLLSLFVYKEAFLLECTIIHIVVTFLLWKFLIQL